MKKFILFIVLIFGLLMTVVPVQAATDVEEVIGRLLAEEKIDEAKIKIEEYLKKYPNDVDVLMMKGNVVLNEYYIKGGIYMVENENESIYDPTIGSIGESPEIVAKDVALKVAIYWKKCLQLDNSREDIHQGLCYLYASALLKDELIEQLRQMKEALPNDEGLAFVMGDYAQMLYDRNEYTMCMEVYQFILKLFPDEAGLYSDIASLSMQSGYLSDAEKYISIAITKKNPDEMVYNNAFLIYTINGKYDQALANLKKLQNDNWPDLYKFYHALLLYYREDKNWTNIMKDFSKTVNKDAWEYEKFLADFLLSGKNKHDFKSYITSSQIGASGVYSLIIHRRAMNKFGDKFEPFYNYAEYLTYFKSYIEAINAFMVIESKNLPMTKTQSEDYYFYYGWALQDSGKIKDANEKWIKLLNSEDFYKKSAAAYFYGKNLLTEGKKAEAIKIFKTVANKAQETKYSAFCATMVAKLEKKK